MAEPVRFQVVNPATGQPGRTYEGISGDEALAIARKARVRFETWRRTSFAERAEHMRAAAAVLRRRADEFAELMTEEMGKTLADGRAEVEKCAVGCDHFAEHAKRFLADQPVDMGGPKAKVVYRPLGTILAVMPWNFPFWQAFRFAAPTIMAGNTAVLKHASNVPGSALAIEEVFREAGFPDDVFRTVLVPSRDVKALIEDPAIAAVSLTGSVPAGKAVAAQAGAVLKKCVLELGGSDAYVVLDDVDVAKAAKVAAAARMVNAGQSCIAGKRFIVLASVREAFEQAMAAEMQGYAMGDPRAEGTKLGPLQAVKARDDVHDQVVRAVAAGARLLTGGEIPDRPGAWYPPTVLTDVAPGNPAFDEEVFGPVAAIVEAQDEAEAIRLANTSEFGLGSGVLTGDAARGERIASDGLEAGMSFVNTNVRSDARLPFGGVKHSGYGRELAAFGIHEFVNIKSVLVATETLAHSGPE
ncbi:NAD-dependent succinate-semialdehyde dehydrogenase [Phenylobacterium sp. J367]|uniref:NAD-dependent succinate-semialdehyde dehydrogenase n=1 Tax=Phenylobacterium sp. J367 TaxID=2898435 RepID=UPI0021513DA4|nr:NAD-dependent succinate-semialdehyde dehydrogenase [Phenylobacterium sp. J367]MCR5880916.1 NAD-dependent succinate-semialdehyde dehydrogenase [Phenylobacterium sp. J367]